MDIIAFILAHKVTILFIIASTGFCFSTIWLGVENANLKTDLSRREITPTPLTPLTDEATTSPLSTTPSPIDMAKYRLPSTVKPLHYDLYFYPSLSTGLFHGVVTIDVEILKSTTEIVLHSQDLTISEATIDGIKGEFETDEKFELLTIRRNDKKAFTPKSNHKVLISFNGDMKKGIVGLYRSSYYNNDGELKYIATSKFEPTYARQAYPCFDEPNLKATYKVHLLRPNDLRYIALSNYPEESEMPITDGIMVHFEKSKPMSTYLACFIVCDFSHSEKYFRNKDKETKFRVYTTPGQLSKADYAIKVGVEIMEFYVKYFDIEYPLPKLDMIAIPDFVSGAMEHWGLVTFRETSLLYSADQHSSANKQRVAEVVAHELAHSWFGNLVTMNWWNNLWLNEGFATYIEYKGVDSVHSDWKMMDQFIVDSLHSILALDATEASHPIIQKVETPDQITEVFDAISYNKGAAILRMLEYAIGEKAFKNGVTNYLRKHAFKNAVNMDLWKEIQDIVGRDKLDVYTFMDTYTMQIGYPVIDVEFQGNNCILRQKRFVLDKDATKDSAPAVFQYKWTIPISYITNYGESEIYWFNYTEDQLILDLPPGFQYIKFNPRQVGYYRVNYHDDVWRNIINFIVQLSPADKAHVLDEVFSLAQAGELSYHVALDATTYLITESNYVPWAAAAPKLVTVAAYFKNTPIETELQNYVIHLLWPMYEKLTWDDSNENELHLVKRLRVTILSLACSFGAEPALEEARKRLLEWHGDKDKVIAPNLRAIVYKYGMMDLSTKEWHTMFDRFADEQDANEKLKLLNGLANVNNPALLTQLINLGKNERYIRSQDYFTMLQYISNNPAGTGLVWDYVREHWDELVARFTLNDRYLGRLIPAITSSFTTKVKLGEMERFFSDNPDAGAGASARLQALERVKNNILWLEKYKTDVELWFDKRKKRDI